MTARKRRPAKGIGPIDALTCSVRVERNGAVVELAGVPCALAGPVLSTLLDLFRVATKDYPELVPDMYPVGGYAPLGVDESSYADERHRVGFGRRAG